MPVLGPVGDDVAAGAVRRRVEPLDEIEVEDALLIEADESEPVVVSVDVEPGGLPELDGLGPVGNGQCRSHVDAPGTADQPLGTDPTDLDLVAALQRRHHRVVSNLTAA